MTMDKLMKFDIKTKCKTKKSQANAERAGSLEKTA